MGTKINTAMLSILIAMGTWTLNTTRSLELRMQALEQSGAEAKKNRWLSSHQQIWSGRLKQLNPTLAVPDPVDVIRAIE